MSPRRLLVALPAIGGTPAAASRSVFAYDAQLMVGNGPRTGEFLTIFIDDLGELRTRLAPDLEAP